MAEVFISLAEFVCGSAAPISETSAAAGGTLPAPLVEAASAAYEDGAAEYAAAATIDELTLMRVAAAEAFEAAIARALAALVADVLGRELALAPSDVEALARTALAECGEAEPVRLVVSTSDAARVRTSLPVRVDPALTAGDLIVEVLDGALESRLSFRVAAAVARALDGR